MRPVSSVAKTSQPTTRPWYARASDCAAISTDSDGNSIGEIITRTSSLAFSIAKARVGEFVNATSAPSTLSMISFPKVRMISSSACWIGFVASLLSIKTNTFISDSFLLVASYSRMFYVKNYISPNKAFELFKSFGRSPSE